MLTPEKSIVLKLEEWNELMHFYSICFPSKWKCYLRRTKESSNVTKFYFLCDNFFSHKKLLFGRCCFFAFEEKTRSSSIFLFWEFFAPEFLFRSGFVSMRWWLLQKFIFCHDLVKDGLDWHYQASVHCSKQSRQ